MAARVIDLIQDLVKHWLAAGACEIVQVKIPEVWHESDEDVDGLLAQLPAGVNEGLKMRALRLQAVEYLRQLSVLHIAIVYGEGLRYLRWVALDRLEVVGQALGHLVCEAELAQEQPVLQDAGERRQRRLLALLDFVHEFQISQLFCLGFLEQMRLLDLDVLIEASRLHLRSI